VCKKGKEKGDDPKEEKEERNHCTAAELSVNAGGLGETTSGAMKKENVNSAWFPFLHTCIKYVSTV
jgi:hypothetical protein